MSRFHSSAALAAAGLAMLACAPANARNRVDNYVSNRGIESVNQPVVQRTDYVIDLAGGPNGIAPSDLYRLREWFDSLQLGYGDRVSIDQPTGYESERAHEDVARVAERYGLFVADGAPITAGAVQPGTLRVVVSRSVAYVPGCPNWHHGTMIGNTTATESDYGCGVNSNLAAMVADPNDLVLGQTGSGKGAAQTASKAIKVYRDAPPTGTKGLKETSTSQGGK